MTTFLQVLLVVWLTGAIIAWLYVLRGMHRCFVQNDVYHILNEDGAFAAFIFSLFFMFEMLLSALVCLLWPLQYVKGGTRLVERIFWGRQDHGQ